MHSLNKHSISVVLIFLAVLVSSCSDAPYFHDAPTHIAYRDAPASILNRGWISGSSTYALHCMRMRQSETPENNNERIAIAEREIAKAKRRLKSDPEKATANYLKAAEVLWPVVRDHANPSDRAYWGEQKRLIIAHQLYTHAVGQTTQLLVQSHRISPGQKTVQLGRRTLTFNTLSTDTVHPSYFDKISPLDTSSYGNIGSHHYTSTGLGAAIIGHQSYTKARLKENNLLPSQGLSLPINAIIDYTNPKQPRLTLTNLLKTNTTTITGTSRPLSADYSATFAAMTAGRSTFLGLYLAIRPDKEHDEYGLFAIGPYDPAKIPVIFIHGLVSQPSTWTTASNYLMGDPLIRDKYQFYYYFYPTSVSPVVSGSQLRQTLLDLQRKHHNKGPNQLNRTVLIGHSMGGLLSSIQSRKFDQNLWNSIFKGESSTTSEADLNKRFHVLFQPPVLTSIERTIFISTPHLGSELANGWIGRIGTALITLPQNILSLQILNTTENLTELGRSLFNQDGPASSITRLEPNNPALTLLKNQPFSSRIKYHSIIGDRGRGNTPDSSDGVVPYWSSHLKGAASEKIVPSNHEAHLTREAHEEMARILHLHLKEGKK